jgi:hypothetical protein
MSLQLNAEFSDCLPLDTVFEMETFVTGLRIIFIGFTGESTGLDKSGFAWYSNGTTILVFRRIQVGNFLLFLCRRWIITTAKTMSMTSTNKTDPIITVLDDGPELTDSFETPVDLEALKSSRGRLEELETEFPVSVEFEMGFKSAARFSEPMPMEFPASTESRSFKSAVRVLELSLMAISGSSPPEISAIAPWLLVNCG